jgi:hypothetical protein
MNQRELASVLFAVVGVFIAITRLPELVFYIGFLAESSSPTDTPVGTVSQRVMSTIGIVASLAAILLGSGLILLRHRLANRLFEASNQALRVHDAQAVALSVVGCYIAVQGISRFGWAFRFDWTAAIQLVLGVSLFFGASGLSGLWFRLRSAGRSPTTTESTLTRDPAEVLRPE